MVPDGFVRVPFGFHVGVWYSERGTGMACGAL